MSDELNTNTVVEQDNSTNIDAEKTFTQSEVDRIVGERIKRANKETAQKIEDERKKAAMDESERLKVEKQEAENHAKSITEIANKRIITAEAKTIAMSVGVKAERLNHFVKLLDTSEIAVNDNGDIDAKALKTAVDSVLADFPEFAGQTQTSKAGSEFSTANKSQSSLDGWIRQLGR